MDMKSRHLIQATTAAILSVTLGVVLNLWSWYGEMISALVASSPGVQILVSGAVISAISRATWLALRAVEQALLTTITVHSSETAVWDALMAYLMTNNVLRSKNMTVKRKKPKAKTHKKRQLDLMLGKNEMELEFTPGDRCRGTVPFKGDTIILTRYPDGAKMTVGWQRRVIQPEYIQLRCWGSKPDLLKDFMSAAVASLQERDAQEIHIMTIGNDWPGGWQKAVTKKVRSLESVVLDGDLQQRMLLDARDFLASAEWYAEAGIPYRRGYLLYGPPGCGKTSFCQALAGALRLDVCMLSLSNKEMTDNDLAAHLRDAPPNSIVLLEDVDAVFVGRDLASGTARGGGASSGVTFSGLLNAIDGAAAQEGRMLFMTTNHIERLDPALIRPGRCDVKQLVDNASRDQMRRLFIRFFKGYGANAAAFAAALPDGELSMAKLQGFLLEHKGDLSGASAVCAVPDLLLQSKPVPLVTLTAWAHLRRLGLERHALLFEYHGYSTKAAMDAARLKAGECAHWCVDLASDAHAMRRLKLLLEGGKGDKELLVELYSLAELSTVQDAFITACLSDGDDDGGGGVGGAQEQTQAALPTRILSLQRSKSSGLTRSVSAGSDANGVAATETDKERELIRSFVSALTSADGKSIISVWQLRWLLEQHAHDPAAAVSAARHVAEARPPVAGAACPAPMTAYAFLRRLGLEDHADAVEGAGGCATARELVALSRDDLVQKCGLRDKRAVGRILAVGARKAEDAALTREFQCPGSVTVRRLFDVHFPPQRQQDRRQHEQQRRAFAHKVTDKLGFGLASLHQIDAHLAKHAADAAAAGQGAQRAVYTAVEALIDVVREPPPTKPVRPEPTAWVHGWLKEAGLEQYSAGFIRAELSLQEDLVGEPALEEDDLENSVGVMTLGHRRKIMRMLIQLRASSC